MYVQPCADFAPDSLGPEPEVCSGCLWYADAHVSPFAFGWVDGYNGAPSYDQSDDAAAYKRGRKQGEVDRRREAAVWRREERRIRDYDDGIIASDDR